MSRRRITQILLIALWMACVLIFSGVVSAQGSRDDAFERVKEVHQRHIEILMARFGVVGTGIGYNDEGELAIKVFTETAGIPGLPSVIEKVPVQTIVSGKFVARADPTARFPRPVPIGVSTGHPAITAGTIGCRVKDASGNIYALSNNHVYANQNEASIGDAVIQPGTYDEGTSPADDIGVLANFAPIDFFGGNNTIDAAIASTNTGLVGAATPADDGYGAPSSTIADPLLLMNVKKYGRTTGQTTGAIVSVNLTVDVGYDVGTARFVNQIAVYPGNFSAGGDSGSLVVTEQGNEPVGLLFAGNALYTIANPIGAVLEYFDVTVDDGSGTPPPTNDPPKASFTPTIDELSVTFTDTSTDSDGSVVAWAWNFGDDSPTSDVQNPTHTYAAAGTYTVTLTVTDDDGATDATSQDVTVSSSPANNPPTAKFTYVPTDLIVNFTDESTDSDGSVDAWAWNFGDGTTSSVQNPTHTYTAAGTYTVTLTVTDDDGATDTTSQDVTVSSSSGGKAMYVWAITFKETGPHLKVTVTIQADSDEDGTGEASDDPLSNATVTLTLARDPDASSGYTGTTDSSGQVQFSWKKAPSGAYTATVADLTHSDYAWNDQMGITSATHTK